MVILIFVTGAPISGIVEGKVRGQKRKKYHMAMQLTPEQEQRIQAIVNAGAYPSAQEALDAAVAAVEIAAALGFEGSQDELEGLLLKGLASHELSEEEFWDSVERETDQKLAAHKPVPRA
ncbi:MAG TPA: hypothetical protein VHW09_10555 [Bryobacteraceae bacterium]|nr:hypothetical protein [Bryobacteraceae bacterium]